MKYLQVIGVAKEMKEVFKCTTKSVWYIVKMESIVSEDCGHHIAIVLKVSCSKSECKKCAPHVAYTPPNWPNVIECVQEVRFTARFNCYCIGTCHGFRTKQVSTLPDLE